MNVRTSFPAYSGSASIGAPIFDIQIHSRRNVINQFGVAVDKEIQKNLFRLAQQTRDKARRAAPVLTGALRASIYATRYGTDKQQDMGYFRAIQAAVRKRAKGIASGLIGAEHALSIRDDGMKSVRRQVPLHYGKTRMSKMALRRQSFRPMMDAQATENEKYGVYYVYVGAAAWYAGFVEYGHNYYGNYVAPQPFLGPAVEWARSQMPIVIMEALQNANRDIAS